MQISKNNLVYRTHFYTKLLKKKLENSVGVYPFKKNQFV